MNDLPLDTPAFYAPWMKGVYEVSPSLRPFGSDFGNGSQDQKLFQFDSDYPRYRESKVAAVAESPSKYVARSRLSSEVETAVIALAGRRLVEDCPGLVSSDGDHLWLMGREVPHGLDELFFALQEDVAIVSRDSSGDWIAYVNVCNPSHWLPTEKIGRSFFEAHTPIPGFEKVNAAAGSMVDSMIHRGPFVRFVWGLESDDHLNHHPESPPGMDQAGWYGRQFEKGIFVRVERQVLWPLPEVSSALFTIRPYVYPLERIRQSPEMHGQLAKAYLSMSNEALAYKGLPKGLEI